MLSRKPTTPGKYNYVATFKILEGAHSIGCLIYGRYINPAGAYKTARKERGRWELISVERIEGAN